MDEKDWRIIKVVAEEQNITKAAKRLFISQPALTYRLKGIEDAFGAKILARLSHGVVLTPQGELLLGYAEEMLARLDRVKDQVRNMESRVQGVLRVGSSGVFAHYMLPRLFKGFCDEYPEVDITLKTGLSSLVIQLLDRHEVNIGIVRGDHEWAGEKILLTQEPVCLVSSKPLSFADLLTQAHVRYGTDTSLRKMLDEWWRKNFSAPPHTTMEVNTMDIARQMVLHGLGWTVLPKIGLPQSDSLYIKELFWPDGSPLIRQTWLFCATGAMELQTVRAFVQNMQSYLASAR